jgi:hypothetical protein
MPDSQVPREERDEHSLAGSVLDTFTVSDGRPHADTSTNADPDAGADGDTGSNRDSYARAHARAARRVRHPFRRIVDARRPSVPV